KKEYLGPIFLKNDVFITNDSLSFRKGLQGALPVIAILLQHNRFRAINRSDQRNNFSFRRDDKRSIQAFEISLPIRWLGGAFSQPPLVHQQRRFIVIAT